jgi:hypothetical protein
VTRDEPGPRCFRLARMLLLARGAACGWGAVGVSTPRTAVTVRDHTVTTDLSYLEQGTSRSEEHRPLPRGAAGPAPRFPARYQASKAEGLLALSAANSWCGLAQGPDTYRDFRGCYGIRADAGGVNFSGVGGRVQLKTAERACRLGILHAHRQMRPRFRCVWWRGGVFEAMCKYDCVARVP